MPEMRKCKRTDRHSHSAFAWASSAKMVHRRLAPAGGHPHVTAYPIHGDEIRWMRVPDGGSAVADGMLGFALIWLGVYSSLFR